MFEERDPLGVVRQNCAVKHVGVGNNDVSRRPYVLPNRRRRIAVVGLGVDREARLRNQLAQLRLLVLS